MASDFKEQKLPNGETGIPTTLHKYEVKEHKIGNQTDTDQNNNKFFSIEAWQVDSDWYCYTNYGRVSTEEYTGACGLYGPSDETTMRAFFESKFKSKVRPSKGYQEISFVKPNVGSPKSRLKKWTISETEIPDEKRKKIEESKDVVVANPISLHPIVERLVNQIYNESSKAITSNAAVTITSDGINTPLGVLTFKQLEKGKTLLGEIGEALKNNDDKEVRKLTGAFYTNIPTKLARKISDDDMINSDLIIQQKLDLIDMMFNALEVGGAAYTSGVGLKYKELGVNMEYIDKSDSEWLRITDKVKKTRGASHYGTTDKVLSILRVELSADREKYKNCKIDNEIELFHGSRNINILGILKSGMKIAPAEAPRSGLAFGKGAYFASSSSKSINYSLYPFPGVENSKNCFLFLFSVKLGKQLVKPWGNGYEDVEAKNGGFDSTWGKSGAGRLQYDEFIVYSTNQCSAGYLVELGR